MGNTATNVTTGKPNIAGAVFVAPKGTALPTDATTALSNAYVCLGFVSDAGLSNGNEISTNVIKAWGGITVYSSLTDFTDTFTLALIETENVDVLKTVYGNSNVTVDGSGNVDTKVKAESPQELVWVFDLALRGDRAKRIVIKNGAITAKEAITYNDSDPVAFGVTITAYPDSDGMTHEEYLEGAETPAPTTFTVTFNSDGGSAVASQTVADGGLVTEPDAPTKDGYTFDAWYADAEHTDAWVFATDTITADTTLYANWTA